MVIKRQLILCRILKGGDRDASKCNKVQIKSPAFKFVVSSKNQTDERLHNFSTSYNFGKPFKNSLIMHNPIDLSNGR